ncbi:MAG: hypothetical protein ACRDSR_19240 [Pseudonocardiaceae bacterium]
MCLTGQITGEVTAIAEHVVFIADLLPELLDLEALGVVVEAGLIEQHGHNFEPSEAEISTTYSSSATSPTSANNSGPSYLRRSVSPVARTRQRSQHDSGV